MLQFLQILMSRTCFWDISNRDFTFTNLLRNFFESLFKFGVGQDKQIHQKEEPLFLVDFWTTETWLASFYHQM